MNRLILVCSLLFLTLTAGCVGVTRIDAGSHLVGKRMRMTIDGAWNHLDFAPAKPAAVWTMEGVYIDDLLIYADIKEGDPMHPPPQGGSKQKSFVFHSRMNTDEVVSMFEGVLSRDGSVFKLIKLEPYTFGGKPGFRFEFERIRKEDNVPLRGVGFGAVDRGELFAMIYEAPRLTFFPRQQPRVEAIAQAISIQD